MKKIILTLVLFFSMGAFAQEMDTTYAITEDGETVGLVHEKGMLPVVPEGMRLVDEVSAEEAVAEETVAEDVSADESAAEEVAPVEERISVEAPAPKAVRTGRPRTPKTAVDSIEYYQDLVDRYTHSGLRTRKVGTGLMVGGCIATLVGTLMVIEGDENDDVYSGIGEVLTGSFLVVAGASVFTTGIVFKTIGGSKLRKAQRYEEKLESYRDRHTFALNVAPMINPVNGTFGGSMALSF